MESSPLLIPVQSNSQCSKKCLAVGSTGLPPLPSVVKRPRKTLAADRINVRLTSEESNASQLRPDEIKILKKVISQAIGTDLRLHASETSCSSSPRHQLPSSRATLPATPRTRTLLGELSDEIRSVLTRRLVEGLQSFLTPSKEEMAVDLGDLEEAEPLPLPVYQPLDPKEPGFVSLISVLAGK